MALTNYGELKAAIADWLNRSDLTSQIPDFITLAEDAIFDLLRAPVNEFSVTYLSTVPDIATEITLPDDYQAAKNVLYGSIPLQRMPDQRYLALMASAPAGGTPRYFSRLGGKLVFYPPSDSAEDVSLTYYQAQGPLATDSSNTPTLEQAPGLYLYGSLLQAQAFLIGDKRIPIWQKQYDEVLARNNLVLHEEGEISGSTTAVTSIYADGRI